LVRKSLAQGIAAGRILVEAISGGMEIVGRKFEQGEYYIPDMLASAEAVGVAMEILAPHLTAAANLKPKGKFILATVEKDQHDIGKNIVGIMLKGAGFQLVDLGVNVPACRIADAIEREGADFVGLSALLDTTMRYMGHTIEELKRRQLRSRVKVLIGGAPTSPEFAREIGADAHCKDAFAAVETANRLAEGRF